MSLLKVVDVHKSFGGRKVLKGVDFAIEEGESVGLFGPNGAGKSTLQNIVTALVIPDRGEIWFDGIPIHRRWPHQLLSVGVVPMFQKQYLCEAMTVEENVAKGLAGPRATVLRTAKEMLARLGLQDLGGAWPSELSSYAARLVELASLLVVRPRFILADEPTAGFSPDEEDSFVQKLNELREELGFASLIIEHRREVLEAVCSRGLLLDEGKISRSGPIRSLWPESARPAQRPDIPPGSRPAGGDETVRLRVSGVTISGRRGVALRDVTLTLVAGESVAIVGPNGSGKTELAKVILGTMKPEAGTVDVDNPIFVPAEGAVLASLTVHDHLLLFGPRNAVDLLPPSWREVLDPLLPSLAATLSGGERRLLGIACAWVQVARTSDPGLLIIDEPGHGLSPASLDMVVDSLNALRVLAPNVALLLLDQSRDVARRLGIPTLDIHHGLVALPPQPAQTAGPGAAQDSVGG